jgi:transposase
LLVLGAGWEVAMRDRAWLVEHRYRAVLEVGDGSPVSEVALRFGVSAPTIYAWKRRFDDEGLAGLQERSRRPHASPRRLAADIEALICELRRQHPRWGARRICYELGRRGMDLVPSRATVHRVLARNGLVKPQEQQHQRQYRRWQREAPMQLWQLDIVGGVFLAGGRRVQAGHRHRRPFEVRGDRRAGSAANRACGVPGIRGRAAPLWRPR